MTSRLTAPVVTVAFAAVTALFGAAVAAADPDPHGDGTTIYCPSAMMYYNPGYCDPNLPDPLHDHCAGGRVGSLMSDGHCDGEHYPDGSYWRVTQHGAPTVENPRGWMAPVKECLVGDGSPAPSGGCGGAV